MIYFKDYFKLVAWLNFSTNVCAGLNKFSIQAYVLGLIILLVQIIALGLNILVHLVGSIFIQCVVLGCNIFD